MWTKEVVLLAVTVVLGTSVSSGIVCYESPEEVRSEGSNKRTRLCHPKMRNNILFFRSKNEYIVRNNSSAEEKLIFLKDVFQKSHFPN